MIHNLKIAIDGAFPRGFITRQTARIVLPDDLDSPENATVHLVLASTDIIGAVSFTVNTGLVHPDDNVFQPALKGDLTVKRSVPIHQLDPFELTFTAGDLPNCVAGAILFVEIVCYGGIQLAEIEAEAQLLGAYLSIETVDAGGGVSDHGALTGLSDDDHLQYALADGSRGDFDAIGAAAAALVSANLYTDAGIVAHAGLSDPHTQYRLEADNHSHQSSGAQAGVLDHGAALTGLTDDDHTQYALRDGRSGGQGLNGDTGSGGNLTLGSTGHATKGKIIFGSASVYDEVNDRFGVGTSSPILPHHIRRISGGGDSGILSELFADADVQVSFFAVRHIRGTPASPLALQNTNILGRLYFQGQYGTTLNTEVANGAIFEASAIQDWSAGNFGTKVQLQTTPSGSGSTAVAQIWNGNGLMEYPSDPAWIAYTPTIATTAGTITTASGSGRYRRIGRTVHLQVRIEITTNGTGAGAITATLPIGENTSVGYMGVGRENALAGKTLSAVTSGGGTILIQNYDNTYPGASGAVLDVSITYQAAAAS